MWSCCGFGRKRRKSPQEVDERTPLIDTDDILPFVQPPAPKAVDDEALLEYQRRIDRILEEAAEKIANVTNPAPLSQILSNTSAPSTSVSASASASSSAIEGLTNGRKERTASNGQHSVQSSTSTSGQELEQDDGDEQQVGRVVSGQDESWRAEKKVARTKGSVHSLQKVQKPKKKGIGSDAKTGKGRPSRAGANETDKVLVNGLPSPGSASDEEEEVADPSVEKVSDSLGSQSVDEDGEGQGEAGLETPRKQPSNTSHQNGSSAEDDLNRALAMSEAEFMNLLTRPSST